MGFVPLPYPDVIAYTEGECPYPELHDKLRGCWVPGLFPGPVFDFSESKDGMRLTSAFRTKVLGTRSGAQSGEEFIDGSFFSLNMRPDIFFNPDNGWTLVFKLRRYVTTPASTNDTGLARFGSAGSTNSHYPWTDGVAYLAFMKSTRPAVTTTFDRTKWHDLTITSIPNGGAGSWNVYVDGLNVHTANAGNWWFDHAADMKVGAAFNAGSYYFQGQIRHCMLYNRILDLETIRRLNDDPFYTPYTGIDQMAFAVPAAPAGTILPHMMQLTS